MLSTRGALASREPVLALVTGAVLKKDAIAAAN
jgi:hypothetical protein